MTRRVTAYIAVIAVLMVVVFDSYARPANVLKAPSAFALGSDEINTGGFCGALPSKK